MHFNPEGGENMMTQQQQQYVAERYVWIAGLCDNVILESGLEIRQTGEQVFSLFVDGFNWMNTNPIDLLDHSIIDTMSGNVILTGLGMGIGMLYADRNPNITSVCIVEKDTRVVYAVWDKVFSRLESPDKFVLVVADANTYVPAIQFDHAYIDHCAQETPQPVKDHYTSFCTHVHTWWEEVHKLEAVWQ